MCGINGYMQYNIQLSVDQIGNVINMMNDSIIHRGPDDEGRFIQTKVGLGMRRLSIIDLQMGRQPIFNENKSLVIVFNGEIYNYKTLREELLAKGHIFTTSSDTEVVLHGYEEYGTNCFGLLKGMFAFAIYNLQEHKMTIVRDRVGEKPLYYYTDSNCILFASELKSILRSGIIRKSINKRALNQYLQLTYIPSPLTIFENIYKLLPGHYMEFDAMGKVKSEQYWDVHLAGDSFITDYRICSAKLRRTLFDAVEECMVADVPVGAFLSGGIDSTTIVGIMSQISTQPINTFTIGYKNQSYDESARAQATATLHKTNHHIFFLEYDDALPELAKMINNVDEPFADSSYIPTYMVSKYARQYVKTVLTGDAGDELFGGYNKYLIGYYSERYNKIPKWVRENIIEPVVYSFRDNSSMMRKVRKVIDNSELDKYDQRKNLMCLGFKGRELLLLVNDDWIDTNSVEFIHDYYMHQQDIQDELARVLYTDLKVVLEGDMLPKVDRASMLNSLETRVPMLHKDVIELAARIPIQYKINRNNTKIILKDTFSDLIPKQLLYAGKKGFGVPIGRWLRNELKEDLLVSLDRGWIEAQSIFNHGFIQDILNEHFLFKRNRASELWTLYVFQKWYKNYFLVA